MTSQAGSSHNIFDPTKSSTFKKSQGATWQIQYGDGSTASGDVGTDVVNAGGLIIQNQAIELALQYVEVENNGTGVVVRP